MCIINRYIYQLPLCHVLRGSWKEWANNSKIAEDPFTQDYFRLCQNIALQDLLITSQSEESEAESINWRHVNVAFVVLFSAILLSLGTFFAELYNNYVYSVGSR